MTEDHSIFESYSQAVRRYYESANRAYPRLRYSENLIIKELSTFKLRKNRKTAIIGPPGSGKTTILDRLSFQLASTKDNLPIFVSLRNYSSSLTELLDVSVRRFVKGLSYGKLQANLPNESVPWLLLDGLDEVAPSLAERFEADLSRFTADYPTGVLVLTSRLALPSRPPFTKWHSHKIEPLTMEEVAERLRLLWDEELVSEVLQRPDLLDLARRPLFLESLIDAFETEADISDYISREVVSYAAWRGHTKSLVPEHVSVEAINSALAQIAFEFVIDEREWFGTEEMLSILDPYARSIDLDTKELYEGLIAADPIQIEGDRVRFRHKSYQTAYCARWLLGQLDRPDTFQGLLKVILASENGGEIAEDLFLESSLEQRELMFNILQLDSIVSLFQIIPESTAEAIRSTFIRMDIPDSLYDIFTKIKGAVGRSDKRRRDIIVLAIHGFNTRGNWKNKLSSILNEETDGERFLYHPWDYGKYRWGLFNPFARKNKVQSFQNYYNTILEKYSNRPEICVVAHSFGTYILGNALKRFPEVEVDRVLLLGAVLPRNYPWNKLKRKCRRVLSIVAQSDLALAAARFIPGLGSAGREGFLDSCSFLFEVVEEYADHSDVFGTQYMRKVWIPFLRDGSLPENHSEDAA